MEILALDIGSRIRVKRLSEDATPIDRMTHIIGKSKSVIPVGGNYGHVTCTLEPGSRLRRRRKSLEGWSLGLLGSRKHDGGG